MKNILITGGAGFVGFHLAQQLSNKGHTVHIIDNFKRPNHDKYLTELLLKNNVKLFIKDISNPNTFDELNKEFYDDIYHFAAFNGTKNFYKYPAEVLKIGCLSTIYLLDWIIGQTKRPYLFFTSSSEGYASTLDLMGERFPIPTPETIALSISDPSNVRWSYSCGKIVSEVAIFSYSKNYDYNNFNIVRLHNIYGPRMGNDHVISEIIKRALNKESPFKIYGPDQTRSFCYISDVLSAVSYIKNKGSLSTIYNIGNDTEEIKIIELTKLIFQILGIEQNFIIEEAPQGSVNRRCPDINKLRSLGFENKTSLIDGLKETISYYREHQ